METNNKKTDEEICKLVQKGDTKSFGILIERYEEKIKRYFQKFLPQKEDIEDLSQNVFLKAFENIQSFNQRKKFSSWFYAIAHNEVVNFLKKKKKLLLFSLIELDNFLPSFSRDNTLRENFNFDFEKEKEALEKAMEKLDLKYREPLFFILLLNFFFFILSFIHFHLILSGIWYLPRFGLEGFFVFFEISFLVFNDFCHGFNFIFGNSFKKIFL